MSYWFPVLAAFAIPYHAWSATASPAGKAVKAVKTTKATKTYPLPKYSPLPPLPKFKATSTITPGKPAQSIKILPKDGKASALETSFELHQTGPGKAVVQFKTKDPNLEINPRGKFAVQIFVDDPVEFTPSVITREEWKAGQKEIPVSFKGVPAGQGVVVSGEASYMVCHRGTKACKSQGSRFETMIKP